MDRSPNARTTTTSIFEFACKSSRHHSMMAQAKTGLGTSTKRGTVSILIPPSLHQPRSKKVYICATGIIGQLSPDGNSDSIRMPA